MQDLFKYIRKKAPNESSVRNVRELNGLLDLILNDFAEQLRQKQLESLPVAQIQQQFTRTWMGFTFNGSFNAQNGRVKNPATIFRRENCTLVVNQRNNQRTFSFTLSFRTAAVEFDKYEFRCGPVNATGQFSIEARDTAISVRVVMELKKNEKMQNVEVTRAELTKCGKFKIRVTGFGNLGGNSLAKLIIKKQLNNYIREAKADFEMKFKNYIKHTIDSFTT